MNYSRPPVAGNATTSITNTTSTTMATNNTAPRLIKRKLSYEQLESAYDDLKVTHSEKTERMGRLIKKYKELLGVIAGYRIKEKEANMIVGNIIRWLNDWIETSGTQKIDSFGASRQK